MLYHRSIITNLKCIQRSQAVQPAHRAQVLQVQLAHQAKMLHNGLVRNRWISIHQGKCLQSLSSFINLSLVNFNQLTTCSGRCLSTGSTKNVPDKENEEEQKHEDEVVKEPLKTLHRFPNVKQMRTITNLKIYQTGLYFIAVPYVYSAYLRGMVTAADCASSICLMTFATIMLYTISLVARRIICVLKYDEETKEVHISHLTFWGRRRNVLLNLEDIVPLSDTEEGDKEKDAYLKLETYDKIETFYLFHKFCTADERDEIMRIFR